MAQQKIEAVRDMRVITDGDNPSYTNQNNQGQTIPSLGYNNESTMLNDNTSTIQVEKLVVGEINKETIIQKPDKCGKFRKFWDFFHPKSVVDNGQPRLISLDFLRGISIWFMLYGHEIETALDVDYEMQQSYGIFATILMAPGALFASFRTFFIMQSGITHAFVFFNQCFSHKIRDVYVSQLLQIVGAFASWPLWYVFHFANYLMYGFSQSGKWTVPHPFWSTGYGYCHATAFFGIVQPICIAVALVFYTVFVVPYKLFFYKHLKQHHLLYIMCGFALGAATLIIFNFMGFANDIRKLVLKAYPDTTFDMDTSASISNSYELACPANAISHKADTFGDALQQLFLLFLGGKYLQMNSQFAFFMAGLAYGILFASFKLLKQQYVKQKAESEADSIVIEKKYKRVKLCYLLFMTFLPFLFVIYYFPLVVQIKRQHLNGIREPLFLFSIACYFPNHCMVPEFASPLLAVQLWLVLLAVLLFETSTVAKSKKHAENALYLRRFSTYSLSCFIFGYFLSFYIKALGFPFQTKDGNELQGKVSAPVFVGYIITYELLTWIVHCVLDQFQGFPTPDWMVQRFKSLYNIPRRTFKDITEQHLKVKPLVLFGREL